MKVIDYLSGRRVMCVSTNPPILDQLKPNPCGGMKYTGQGKSRFTVVHMENNIIISNNSRIPLVSHTYNCKTTFAPLCRIHRFIMSKDPIIICSLQSLYPKDSKFPLTSAVCFSQHFLPSDILHCLLLLYLGFILRSTCYSTAPPRTVILVCSI